MISIVFSAVCIFIGIAVFIYAGFFQYQATDLAGPMFFPELLAISLIVVSLILIWQKVKQDSPGERVHYRVYTLPLLSMIYVMALFHIGFLFSTIIFVIMIIPYFNTIDDLSFMNYRKEFQDCLRKTGTYKLLIFLILLVWGLFIQVLHIPLR